MNTEGGTLFLLLVLVVGVLVLVDWILVLVVGVLLPDPDCGPRTECVLLILLSETRPTVDLTLRHKHRSRLDGGAAPGSEPVTVRVWLTTRTLTHATWLWSCWISELLSSVVPEF